MSKVSPLEYARKMVAAYAGPQWAAERAWWQRKVEEREAAAATADRDKRKPE